MHRVRAITVALITTTQSAFAQTAADASVAKRGLGFDIWNAWLPADEMVSRPGFPDAYPDWRGVVPPGAVADLSQDGFDFARLPVDPAEYGDENLRAEPSRQRPAPLYPSTVQQDARQPAFYCRLPLRDG